jgi:hypothetical protein
VNYWLSITLFATKPAVLMPGKTRPEYARGAGATSSRKIEIKSFAIPLARKHITTNKRKEIEYG